MIVYWLVAQFRGFSELHQHHSRKKCGRSFLYFCEVYNIHPYIAMGNVMTLMRQNFSFEDMCIPRTKILCRGNATMWRCQNCTKDHSIVPSSLMLTSVHVRFTAELQVYPAKPGSQDCKQSSFINVGKRFIC